MAFDGYLDAEEIRNVTTAAVNSGLLDISRTSLLVGIPAAFVGGLAIRPNPVDQFTVDLVEINRVERMANGVVPVVELLKNSAFQLKLRGRVEAQVFEQTLNRIGNVTGGVPELPDPAQLPEVVRNEKIIGSDDTLDLTFLSRGLELANAVARVAVPRFENGAQVRTAQGDPWVMRGTAWLIAPGIAITNHHVINARNTDEPAASGADFALQAANASLEFDFDRREAEVTGVAVSKLLAAGDGLDYALLEVPEAPARTLPPLAPSVVVLEATTRMAVNIVQHPRGEHKQVAIRNNLVAAADENTLRYYTDTDYGSSGSPVCDDRWRVVALHRGARFAAGANYQGKDEAYVNFGSQIQAVLTDLRATDSQTADQIHAAHEADANPV